MERIPVSGPWITRKEVDSVADAAANAWYSNANTYNQRFEERFANYVGHDYAISLPSCTSAIHLALLALNVGPGDEVIVPDITWIASSAPVSYVGATPVFADVDAKTWCLTEASLRQTATDRTKAVIVVDLYGGMSEMNEISKTARQLGIALIEDAAEAIGSEYQGRKAGSFGDAAVFSFHGSKTLTTGEGGMLLTSRKDIAERVLFLRDHGRNPGDRNFFNDEIAYKYKMSSLQAALGLAQLERVGELVEKKRQLFSWYQEMLSGVEGLQLNYEPPGVKNSYWMVTVVWDRRFGLTKKRAMEWLWDRQIDSRPFFHPLSSLPAYSALSTAQEARSRNHVSYRLSPYGLNLPSALRLQQEQVEYVASALKDLLREQV